MIRVLRPGTTLFAAMTVALLASPASAQSTAETTAEIPTAETIATVNGQPVLKAAHTAIVRQLQQNGQQADNQQILDELINLELLTQKAEALDFHQRTDIAALLRLQYVQTLAQAYMGALSEDINITDDDLQREYDQQTASMVANEFRASHILLDNEAAALDVIKALQDGGDFAALAAERSVGPTGPNGGDLGWFQSEAMVPEFSSAVAQMAIGDYSSEPVKSEFGWHVIFLADKRGAQVPALADISGELRNIILRRELTTLIDSMRSEADIKIIP